MSIIFDNYFDDEIIGTLFYSNVFTTKLRNFGALSLMTSGNFISAIFDTAFIVGEVYPRLEYLDDNWSFGGSCHD